PEHGQRLPPALLQDEEGGETLCCRVPGALFPPLRQGDPFLRFALDAKGEDGSGGRREVEITARLPHRRRQDVARVDTEAVDQVLPDRLLQPPPLGLAGGGGVRGHGRTSSGTNVPTISSAACAWSTSSSSTMTW